MIRAYLFCSHVCTRDSIHDDVNTKNMHTHDVIDCIPSIDSDFPELVNFLFKLQELIT
jgi:hypothetical protein